MKGLKTGSIYLVTTGLVLFVVGVFIYWYTLPPFYWAKTLVATGVLLVLGAIVFLCFSYMD